VIGALLLAIACATPLFAADGARCNGLQERLVGTWSHADDGGFFEVMTFSVDDGERRFDSWLHQRPDVVGASWSVDGCRLVIRAKEDSLPPFEYTAGLDDESRLRLRDRDGHASLYTHLGSTP